MKRSTMDFQNSIYFQSGPQHFVQQQVYYTADGKRILWPPIYEHEGEINKFDQTGTIPSQRQMPPGYNYTFEPPPATITLRNEAPIQQPPAPVIVSQGATAAFKGGKCLRGDTKWPPESVKQQMQEEDRLRMEIAKGPACRPRAVRKDYGPFFAQHALNDSYPKYRVPPGTQFVIDDGRM